LEGKLKRGADLFDTNGAQNNQKRSHQQTNPPSTSRSTPVPYATTGAGYKNSFIFESFHHRVEWD